MLFNALKQFSNSFKFLLKKTQMKSRGVAFLWFFGRCDEYKSCSRSVLFGWIHLHHVSAIFVHYLCPLWRPEVTKPGHQSRSSFPLSMGNGSGGESWLHNHTRIRPLFTPYLSLWLFSEANKICLDDGKKNSCSHLHKVAIWAWVSLADVHKKYSLTSGLVTISIKILQAL